MLTLLDERLYLAQSNAPLPEKIRQLLGDEHLTAALSPTAVVSSCDCPVILGIEK